MVGEEKEPQRYSLMALVIVVGAIFLALLLPWPTSAIAWLVVLSFGLKLLSDYWKE